MRQRNKQIKQNQLSDIQANAVAGERAYSAGLAAGAPDLQPCDLSVTPRHAHPATHSSPYSLVMSTVLEEKIGILCLDGVVEATYPY